MMDPDPMSMRSGEAGRAAAAQPTMTMTPMTTAPAAGGGAGAGAPSAAAGQGAAGSAPAAPGKLSNEAGVYTFSVGRRSLAVDAMRGARITRFGLDEQNLLTGPDVDMLNYGSTFWPSPQERWGWPPVPELDSAAYEVSEEADSVLFSSRPGERAKVAVSKRIRALSREDSFEISYSLRNADAAAVSWAAWEITRVAAGGLSFFPTGERSVGTALPVVEQGGVTWFQHDPAQISGDGQKFTGDGAEGWLAHVAGRTVLVKQFMDVPADAQAPAPEAEIALYAARGYVEIEPQGPYTELMPGAELSWSVRWIIAEVPEMVAIELGSQALVDFVRSLLAQSS
jgi:hypothetical protein